jgi:hypothetical protein
MIKNKPISLCPVNKRKSFCLLLTFTKVECSHLLSLLHDAENRGEYYGNREQYWAHNKRIENKLRIYEGLLK